MIKTLKFYKDILGDWYVDLPEWQGNVADLQMVAGADTMLDILSQGDDDIWLKLSTEQLRQREKVLLELEHICAEVPLTDDNEAFMPSSGAIYKCTALYLSSTIPVWLCDVTLFVFDEFPKTIYIY